MPDPTHGGLVAGASAWLLTYLVHSSVVVGVVWCLLKLGWVRRPTTRDLLWKVALVAALATATVATFGPGRGVSRRLSVEIRGDGAREGVAWRSEAGVPGLVRLRATAVEATPACLEAVGRLRRGPEDDPGVLSRACRGPARVSWTDLLSALWILGAAFLLVRALLARLHLRRSLDDARPAAESVRTAARDLLPCLRRPVSVLVSPSAEAPCVVGGSIVIPERCARDLTPEQIRAVLAHEAAHLLRRDPAWMTVADLVCRALWVQPLNRLALHGLRESAELVCDDWAVDRTRSPLELATSIARVAEWLTPGHRVPEPAVAHLTHLAQGSGRVLSTRVRRILTQGVVRRQAPLPLRLLLAALVVAPTLALPAVPRTTVHAVFLRREVEAGVMAPIGKARSEDVMVVVRRARPEGR